MGIMSPDFEARTLSEVLAVRNSVLKGEFHTRLMETQVLGDFTSQSASWCRIDAREDGMSRSVEDLSQRHRFIDSLQDYASRYEGNADPVLPALVPVLLLGTSETAVKEYLRKGFVLGKPAPGNIPQPYGRGTYLTRDVEYAFASGKVVILAMVNPGQVYPVTEHPASQDASLSRRGKLQSFQSNYVVLAGRSNAMNFPLRGNRSVDRRANPDLLVLFENAQGFPLFVLHR